VLVLRAAVLQVFAEHQLSKDAAIGSAVISIVQVGMAMLCSCRNIQLWP
jgi:hypothetical protein